MSAKREKVGLQKLGIKPEDIGAYGIVQRRQQHERNTQRGRGQPKGMGLKEGRGPAIWAYMTFLIEEFDLEPLEAAITMIQNGFVQVLSLNSTTAIKAWSPNNAVPDNSGAIALLARRFGIALPAADARLEKSLTAAYSLRTDYYKWNSRYESGKDATFNAACDRKLAAIRHTFS